MTYEPTTEAGPGMVWHGSVVMAIFRVQTSGSYSEPLCGKTPERRWTHTKMTYNEPLTFLLLLLIRELLLNGVDFLGGDEVSHVVADAHSLQMASHVIGETDSVMESVGAVGALPLHTPQRLRVLVNLVRGFLEDTL